MTLTATDVLARLQFAPDELTCPDTAAILIRFVSDNLKRCLSCDVILERKYRESFALFAKRTACSKSCALRIRYGPEARRFWSRVDGDSIDTCWQWTGAISGGTGYGNFRSNDKTVLAHRWAYEALRNEIPPDLELDHLCRNRPCVNPWHLEPVTHAVNIDRGHRWPWPAKDKRCDS